ncbi:MAG: alkaline phosphatase D family protein [Planctomycetota bacterium]
MRKSTTGPSIPATAEGRCRPVIGGAGRLVAAVGLLLAAAGPARAVDIDPLRPITRIALGSCIRQDRPQPIWEAITRYDPDVFLLLGDNIYGDTRDMVVLRAKYATLAANGGFAALRRTTPIVAVWDDHDFGADDAGSEYPMRRGSQEAFLDFFGIPADAPLRTQEGIYRTVTAGPPGRRVQFICLDTRYHRSPLARLAPGQRQPGGGPYRPTDDPAATVLGAEQRAWFARALREPAEVRIVMSSIQFAFTGHHWEHWGNFPAERARVLRLIRESGAGGVMFVSGDRHAAEISRIPAGPEAAGYPLYDLTASSLNQPLPAGMSRDPNPLRLGPHQREVNFGTIDIEWLEGAGPEPAGATITLGIRDLAGAIVHAERFRLADLAPATATP